MSERKAANAAWDASEALRALVGDDKAPEAFRLAGEIADYRLREAAVTVRAQAPKYLDTAESIAAFLVLDKAAALIEPNAQ